MTKWRERPAGDWRMTTCFSVYRVSIDYYGALPLRRLLITYRIHGPSVRRSSDRLFVCHVSACLPWARERKDLQFETSIKIIPQGFVKMFHNRWLFYTLGVCSYDWISDNFMEIRQNCVLHTYCRIHAHTSNCSFKAATHTSELVGN